MSATIFYVFDEETLQLIAVGLSQQFNIEINCQTPVNYTRSGSEVTFDIGNNEVTGVHFSTTGIRELDELFSDNTFQNEFINMVNDNKP